MLKPHQLYLTLHLFICLAAVSAAVFGQEQYRAQVHLNIEYDDQSTRNELHSFAARELRSLGDVDIVEQPSAGGYSLALIMVSSQGVNDNRIRGYAISALITQRSVCRSGPSATKDAPAVFLPCDEALDHVIYTCGPDGLKKVAQEIIASFDSEILDPDRHLFQLLHRRAG